MGRAAYFSFFNSGFSSIASRANRPPNALIIFTLQFTCMHNSESCLRCSSIQHGRSNTSVFFANTSVGAAFKAESRLQQQMPTGGGQSNATSKGVRNPSTSRGVWLCLCSMRLSFEARTLSMLKPFGKSRRSRPIWFSLVPRWLGACGSQT